MNRTVGAGLPALGPRRWQSAGKPAPTLFAVEVLRRANWLQPFRSPDGALAKSGYGLADGRRTAAYGLALDSAALHPGYGKVGADWCRFAEPRQRNRGGSWQCLAIEQGHLPRLRGRAR